jgi:chromosomal replication initiator protein
VVDHITEIFLPGRTVASATGDALGFATGVMLPSFVAGPENRLVATAVGALVDDVVNTGPRLLALYGPSGSGKTHLARGVVRHWQEHRGPESAEYFTASDFRRAFLAAIDADNVGDFRRRTRGRQLFAIDDLQQLPDDEYLLQELRYTLDEYAEAGGTVLITANEPVAALNNISADIRSRLSGGLVLQLALPGAAARQQILRQVAAALGRPLSEEVASRLASGIDGAAHELFAAVFELCASSPNSAGDADVKQAERLLAARAARRPTVREIVAVVAKYYRQPQAVLKSDSRRQSAVLPRATIIFLARELTDCTYEQIGRALGGRDHTTIMHSYKKIDHDRQHDLGIQESLDELRRILLSR